MATITQHHQYDASPAKIFRALTDAKTLCTWWTTTAESDPFVGGGFRYEFLHTPAGLAEGKNNMVQEGKYIECDASAIEYEWDVGAPTNVRFVLNVTADGGTDLKLVHDGVSDDDATVQMISESWEFFLGNLRGVLAGEDDQRPAVGLITDPQVAV